MQAVLIYQRCNLCLTFALTEGIDPGAGQSETDTRHFSIEGTSFNPNSGAVKGLSSLDSNLEV